MKRHIAIIFTLSMITLGCRIIEPEPYISTDWGVNDYLPLAVGNTWTYDYTYTSTTEERYQPSVTSTSYLGYEKWEVKSVRKKSDSIEVFAISIIRKEGKDSSVYIREIERIATHFYDLKYEYYGPRTGIEQEYGGNPYYKKGVGMTKRTWGSTSGGPGTRGSSLYSLRLSSYKIKS